jgi:hypothetical protein
VQWLGALHLVSIFSNSFSLPKKLVPSINSK